MIITEPDGFVCQLVDVGGLDDGVAGAAEVTISLIIGDHENDIGFIASKEELGDEEEWENVENGFHKCFGCKILNAAKGKMTQVQEFVVKTRKLFHL